MRLLFVTTGPDFAPGLHSKWTLQGTLIKSLEKRGIECKRVIREEYLGNIIARLPVLNTSKKRRFERRLDELKPDAVVLDIPNDLGTAAASKKIPVLVYFWDIWSHLEMAREGRMVYRSMYFAARARIMNPCLKKAVAILAETDSIADTIREHYPQSSVVTFPYSSIDTDFWRDDGGEDVMALRHPCVGLLQHANAWFKAKEMLTLPKVVEALPHVTFYWAGDGRYRDRILGPLAGYDNFEWLGPLEDPARIRDYLSSIDIYGLASGIDMSPYSLKQAMSMEKPAIATDVGGVSETMRDGVTGFLVMRGDHRGWIERIMLLLGDAERARDMGKQGRRLVRGSWDNVVAAEKFVKIVKEIGPK